MRKSFCLILMLMFAIGAKAQYSDDYSGGLKVKFNEDGSKYLRVIAWAQLWAQSKEAPSNSTADNFDIGIRRARLLAFTQINDRFLLLAHFGTNSLFDSTLSPSGKGEGSQMFFHDVWGEFKVSKDLQIGAGLHYWNGITRSNNQSTLNMMTLDNINSGAWPTLNLSDQFARHLGIYAKGTIGKLGYRFSVNDAMKNATLPTADGVYYAGTAVDAKKANLHYSGYLEYMFGDKEGYLLPFKVGTYLGKKKIFNVGVGFSSHPSGIATVSGGNTELSNATHFAADVFVDQPMGTNGGITAYASYMNSDIGAYNKAVLAGTGSTLYGHVGYLIPKADATMKNRIQPYVSYTNRNYDVYDVLGGPENTLGFGLNWYIAGHNAKITAEYVNKSATWYTDAQKESNGTFTIQAHIFL